MTLTLNLKILTAKSIGSGTVPVTTELSPNTTSAKGWLVKTIFIYNPGQDTITVDLKIKQGANTRMLKKAALTVPGLSTAPVVLEKEITLDLSIPDILVAVCKTSAGAPTADCVVTGVERDQ